jgi:hypothetical protein
MRSDADVRVVRGGPLARWASVAAGAWIFVSPWVLRTASPGHHGLGVVVMLVALAALIVPSARWLNVAAAVVLVGAPILFGWEARRLLASDVLAGLALLTSATLPTLFRR